MKVRRRKGTLVGDLVDHEAVEVEGRGRGDGEANVPILGDVLEVGALVDDSEGLPAVVAAEQANVLRVLARRAIGDVEAIRGDSGLLGVRVLVLDPGASRLLRGMRAWWWGR